MAERIRGTKRKEEAGIALCSVLSPDSVIPDRSKSQINVIPWSLAVSSGQLTRSKPAERPGGKRASISSK